MEEREILLAATHRPLPLAPCDFLIAILHLSLFFVF